MNNPSKNDIARSLTELSDDDAIAIMEGRMAVAEKEATKEAARTLAVEVLEAPEDTSRLEEEEPAGGNVVQLITRQPWMRMAAAMVAGIAIASAVNAPLQMADTGSFGLASANVTYLEVTRSASADVPVIELHGEPWVTLLAYPETFDAEVFRIYLEKAVGSAQEPESWLIVLQETTPPGTEETLVVNVRSKLLTQGTYRLRVDGETGGETVQSTTSRFKVLPTPG